MSLPAETFQLSDPLQRMIKGWTWPVVFGVIGVAAGLGFSLLIPARYEAASTFSVSVIYGVTEKLELVVEDRVLDRVWQLAISDETMRQTKELLEANSGAKQAWGTIDSLRQHTRLDARLSRWELIGIHPDPSIAVEIANAWRSVTLDRLDAAYEHAWNAYSIQGVAFDVECVKLLTEESSHNLWTCVNSGPGVTKEDEESFRSEIEASLGILPIIEYEPVQLATPPDSPVLWPRGLMTFFGGTLGFVIGISLLLINPTFFKRKDRPVNSDPSSM